MGSASKYWCLVQIDGSGQRRLKEVAIAKSFLQQEFAELIAAIDVPDSTLQAKLLDILRDSQRSISDRDLAELCLRCFISHQIEQMCIRLELQFGARHGFTRLDLLAFVLEDDGRLRSQRQHSTQYRLLAATILETFDSSRANLSTWTMRLVRNHSDLNAFLRERGVYLTSDWSILNDTSPEQAKRILLEFYMLTPAEGEQASHLLQAYHLVYRQDRYRLKQTGVLKGKEQCKPPTLEQLTRIAEYYQQLTTLSLAPDIMSRLRTLATQLRQYRVSIRSGASLMTTSLDEPTTRNIATALPSSQPDDAQENHNEFLMFYREQFLQCLDESLEQATRDRVAYLQRKKDQKQNQFLKALYLFHCQGQAMAEIAPQVALKAQFEVSRLMKLKDFRSYVQQKLLGLLSDRILQKAKTYLDAQQLHNLDRRIEAALNEQLETVMQQAEAEAVVTKHRPLESLFARRLCRHLDTWSVI